MTITTTSEVVACMCSALSEAKVVALFVEAIFCGIYLATLPLCLRSLVYAHDHWTPLRINWPSLTLTLAFCATSSLHMSLSLRRIVTERLGRSTAGLFWMTSLFVHIQVLLAGAVMSKIVPVFPVLLWLTCIACSIIRVYSQTSTGNTTHQSTMDYHIILLFWTCTIAINTYVTCLITFQLMRLAQFNNLQTRRIRFVMRVIIESGMLYTATASMVLISWLMHGNASQLIISGINFQIVGITFNLMTVLVRRTTSASGLVGETDLETTVTATLTTIPARYYTTSNSDTVRF
ncbi:hypothetical protein F5887DRAFT_928041 [Amanita rubescens]|nr:hypothetical protein F5887DRAFT_928041 [Amanita rubescens]